MKATRTHSSRAQTRHQTRYTFGHRRGIAYRSAHANLRDRFATPGVAVDGLAGKIEMEIGQLEPEDAAIFLEDLGIAESSRDRIIRVSFELLGLIPFFTVGPDECRAWTIRLETKSRHAAGAFNSDIEKAIIRAELCSIDDLFAAGTWADCRDRGTLRLEGKDYAMQDGDVVNFRFNV